MYVSNRIGKGYVVGSTLLSATFILAIVSFLVIHSWDAMAQVGWGLFTTTWNPPQAQYGVWPMVYGSAAVTVLALILAVPLGLLTAIFTSEILPARFRLYVKSLLELLAGIPSIIYGLIGVVFLSPWVEGLFDLSSGRTILAAGFLLAIMVLPTLITLSDDALRHVPGHYREAARGLGLYAYEVVHRAVLPLAKADIVGAILLAMGRALGETMAVMLVIGGLDRLPQPLGSVLVPGQTVTSKLGREIAEAAFGSLHFSAMIFMGFLLLVVVLGLTTVTLLFFYNPERRLDA